LANPTIDILSFFGSRVTTLPSRMTGIPASVQLPDELNGGLVRVVDYKSSSGLGEARTTLETFSGSPSHTYTLPSSMPDVTPTNVAATPYRRVRFQFTLPADLDDAATIQIGYGVGVRLTAAYLGGRTVDYTFPDLTAVSGWSNSYGPTGTLNFSINGEKNTRTTRCTPGISRVASRYGVI
jgi:hypothetical protein